MNGQWSVISGYWDADEADLLRKDADKNGFLYFNVGGEAICADLFVVGCALGVINCYCWPPRRLAPSLKQSTGLFFLTLGPLSTFIEKFFSDLNS